jgi:type III secretory pathway component EscS
MLDFVKAFMAVYASCVLGFLLGTVLTLAGLHQMLTFAITVIVVSTTFYILAVKWLS